MNKEYAYKSNDIAIIGIAIKFPKADNVDQFWDILSNGVDCIRELPNERRRDTDKYIRYAELNIDSSAFSEGGYIESIAEFDNDFFGISPKEAELTDPEQRIFLQLAYQCIEDAGYMGEKIKGTNTGVFVGYGGDSEYKSIIASTKNNNVNVTGNLGSFVSSRIAYMLDLTGPTMVIDTSCSSSLTALHIACESIISHSCSMALVGGVQLFPIPIRRHPIGAESSTGRTKAFDDSSDGTGSGEGVGVIMIKSLSEAINDGDNIYAIIKGSAINGDGNTIGLTAPNPLSQEKVIVQAWENAKIDPETITYIEAHGTGTKLGDPIELTAIKKAFQNSDLIFILA